MFNLSIKTKKKIHLISIPFLVTGHEDRTLDVVGVVVVIVIIVKRNSW